MKKGTWKEFGKNVLDIVIDAEGRFPSGSGARKRRWAIARISELADEAMVWGDGPVGRALELVDGVVVRVVATVAIEVAVAALPSVIAQRAMA